MRIGVNVVPLRVNSGGARYVFAALFEQLLKLDREHRYIVFAHPAGIALVREIVEKCNDAFGTDLKLAERVRVVCVVDEELIYPHRDEFDLYFCPINSLKPRILDRPNVVILHDIQEQYFPQYFSYADLMSRHEVYPEFCRAATVVVTVSDFCKQCLVEKFAVDPRKIEVVHNAPQPELIAADLANDGSWPGDPFPRPYFFYPANTYPHKNHALLLDAIEVLSREYPAGARPHAVFTGQPMAGGYPLNEQIRSRKLEDLCHVYGNLSGGEMRHLYRNATAVVMPTMFEGFGMPAVEALACGTPLICSGIPALREVAGNNALYFPPGDLDALCGWLRRIISDPAVGSRLIESGREIAGRFTWEAAGQRMLDIFASADERFTFGNGGRGPRKPRPRIGVLVQGNVRTAAGAATFLSLVDTRYKNLVVGVIGDANALPEIHLEVVGVPDAGLGDADMLIDFARRASLDLVGMSLAGNRLRPTSLNSLAMSLEEFESAVHLGEAAVWRGGRYRGIARLRYTGDQMWRIEKLLYPELLFLAPAALSKWPAGEAILANAPNDWRWKLLLAARAGNQLTIVRRTLADCDRSSLPPLAWIKAFRAGMLDFHRMDNSPAPVPILRRFERRVRMLSQLLPQPMQHLGTKWWYRLTRSRAAADQSRH